MIVSDTDARVAAADSVMSADWSQAVVTRSGYPEPTVTAALRSAIHEAIDTLELAAELEEEKADDNGEDEGDTDPATAPHTTDAKLYSDRAGALHQALTEADGCLVSTLKARFPWLGTDEAADGADVVDTLVGWYEELAGRA